MTIKSVANCNRRRVFLHLMAAHPQGCAAFFGELIVKSGWRAAGVSFCLFLLGCGGGTADRPQTAPVSGRLVKDGVPVPEARIEFIPQQGAASSAITNSEGKFELIYVDGSRGAKIGTHQVRITIGGVTMGTADGDAPPPPKKAPDQPMLYVIPTPQTVSVGKNEVELKLPAQGQPG